MARQASQSPSTDSSSTSTPVSPSQISTGDDRVVQVETEDSDSDPFFEYAYLGDCIEDGLLAWVTLGVNVMANHDSAVLYAATLTSNGGVANDDSAGGAIPSSSPGSMPPA